MKDTNIHWHPGFVAAMDLELRENRSDLQYEKEYNLNTKPLEVDLLIIKKKADLHLKNEIGRIFRGHNILEYKDPNDQMDVDVFYKVEGYACLYKSYGATVDAVKADDVTITLIREAKPEGLFRYFMKHGYRLSNPYRGIYYVEGMVLFPSQTIVTKELDQESHIWLKSLSGKLKKQDMRDLLEHVGRLNGKLDKELASSVLEVSMRANEQMIETLIGDDDMSEALLEMVAPIIEPIMQRREECARIQGAVSLLHDFGHQDAEIKAAIMRKYDITAEEADNYLKNSL